MKTITIILSILFFSVIVFLGVVFLKNISQGETISIEESITAAIETESTESIDSSEVTAEVGTENTEVTAMTSAEQTIEDNTGKPIIKFYLDGDKNSGIYLGEAGLGLESAEAARIFGEPFLNSGFSLEWEKGDYIFEPGSVHNLYIYTTVPGKDETLQRKSILIKGQKTSSDNIAMHLEFPKEDVTDAKELGFAGWVVDTSASGGTNIDRVEFYLDGPAGFGKKLGTADYGAEREDVAESFNNPDFLKSGFRFKLKLDEKMFPPASFHFIYIYAYSSSGQFGLIVKDIKIEGEEKEADKNTAMSVTYSFVEDPTAETVKITGWLVTTDYGVERIVFVGDKGGNEDIYSMNLDGSDLKRLTDAPGSDLYPATSSDGKRIVYSSDVGGVWQIMVMDWDGSNKKQITFNSERNGDPSWSFDDKYIYFERFLEENWELYRMDADGSNVLRLTINPYDDWHPFGHSSQYKILYETGITGVFDIFIMNDDGTNVKRLSESQEIEKRVPSMSPDGKYIVFQGKGPGDKDFNIYIMQENGQDIKKLTNSSNLNGHAIISPDSQHVIYENEIKDKKQLFIMNMDGSGKKQLTFNEDYSSYMPDFIYIKASN